MTRKRKTHGGKPVGYSWELFGIRGFALGRTLAQARFAVVKSYCEVFCDSPASALKDIKIRRYAAADTAPVLNPEARDYGVVPNTWKPDAEA